MLTRDLVRYRLHGETVEPQWLVPRGAALEQAGELLTAVQGLMGRTRREVEQQTNDLLGRWRSLLIGRGLLRCLFGRCSWDAPADQTAAREAALLASAAQLVGDQPWPPSPQAHRALVAQRLAAAQRGVLDDLYADLDDAERLRSITATTPSELITAYNLANAQGLLLWCERAELFIEGGTLAMQRRVLRQLRFRRLLMSVRHSGNDGRLHVAIGGADQALRDAGLSRGSGTVATGLALAQCLGVISLLPQWKLSARLLGLRQPFADDPAAPPTSSAGAVAPREHTLELSHDSGLPGDQRHLAHQPDELRDLAATLRDKLPGCELSDDAEAIIAPGGELVLPDLALRAHGKPVLHIELFHRFHRAALERRLGQIARGELGDLGLGVDRALAKTAAVSRLLEGNAAFARWGFVFSGWPSATALAQLAGRNNQAGSAP